MTIAFYLSSINSYLFNKRSIMSINVVVEIDNSVINFIKTKFYFKKSFFMIK